MTDVATRITEAVRAQRDIEFWRQELAESRAVPDDGPPVLTPREKLIIEMYSLTIAKQRLEHVREVAELERQLRAR